MLLDVAHPLRLGLKNSGQDTTIQALRDVWRISQEPETNSVEVHVSRLRAKLALSGCGELIETVPEGGYRVAAAAPFMLARKSPEFAVEAGQSAWTACPSRSRNR